MNPKVSVASDWLAGCAGCHMSFLDIDERIVQLLQRVRLTSTPITDLKHPDAEGVDVGILEGAVANSATEEVARRMRQRCKILIALGDCAVFGGVPTMRNAVSTAVALHGPIWRVKALSMARFRSTRTSPSCRMCVPSIRWSRSMFIFRGVRRRPMQSIMS